jgi:Ca2+:H+ antiporter
VTATVAAPGSGFTRRDVVLMGAVAVLSVLTVLLEVASIRAEVVFVVSGIAVAGLAWVLGEATDQAGEAAGPQVAALLNASFGNLPELVIVILTIRAGLIDVAKASLIGSVLGNLLFILGFSILLGGWRNGALSFDGRRAGVNASMVTIAVVALGVPTLFASLEHVTPSDVQTLSYWVAGIMFLLYAAYLLHSFQGLGTSGDAHDGGGARWTARQSVLVLSFTALATGALSEILVESIKPTIESSGIPATFIGLIIVPIIGNVAEHLSAVRIAWHGDLDFSMGIAFNSGLQVAFGVTAVAVLAGAIIGNTLDLNFPPLQLALLAASAIMAGHIAADGEANWLEGLELLAIYLLAAISFWFV